MTTVTLTEEQLLRLISEVESRVTARTERLEAKFEKLTDRVVALEVLTGRQATANKFVVWILGVFAGVNVAILGAFLNTALTSLFS